MLRKTDTFRISRTMASSRSIIEINIRYIRETKIFDEMVIKSKIGVESPYMVFMHNMYNTKTRRKCCKASVKYLYLTREILERLTGRYPSKMGDYQIETVMEKS